MKRLFAAALALFALIAFSGAASADCSPGHSAKKEAPGNPTGT